MKQFCHPLTTLLYLLSFIVIPAFSFAQLSVNVNSGGESANLNNQNCQCVEPAKVFPDKASITDTVFCYTWPFQGNAWENSSIIIQTFDENGLLVQAQTKTWDEDLQDYVPASRQSYEYTANFEIELLISEFWNPDLNGGSWDPLSKLMHEYDVNGKLIYTFTWYSTIGDPDWHDGNKAFFSYNEYDLKDTVIYQYWNTIQNEWYYSDRFRYIYDDDLELIEEYDDYANNLEGTFALNVRTIYDRDAAENTVDRINQNYNLSDWVNADHAFQELNEDGQPVNILYQNWDPFNNMWDTLVMQQEVISYNEDGLISEFKTQSYYIMWVNNFRIIYQYHDNGVVKESLTQEWDSFLEQWENSMKCIYPQTENTTTGIELALTKSSLSIYPNPASEQVSLSAQEVISLVSVYNTIGEEVYVATPGANEFTLKTAAWDEGLYFITVKGKDHSITKKLIIRH